MSSKAKILITAANGNTGFPAAKELLTLGFRVRVLVRNPDSEKARYLKDHGAEIFVGDMENIHHVRKSLEGIERAYFVPTYPNVLFQGSVFTTALSEMNIPHVVVMTQWLADPTHYSTYTKEHWLVDQAFKRLEQTEVTFINPGLFGFVYFMATIPLTQFGLFPDFGANMPPSNEDIGLVVAHILKSPAKHSGKTYRVTGKDLLEAKEMAEITSKVLGRKVKAGKLPTQLLFKVLRAYGFPKTDASQIPYYIEEGHKGAWNIGGPTSVVRDIVGKEADDFEKVTRKFLEDHPMSKQSFRNKLKGMLFMIKVLFTPVWNMKKFDKDRGIPSFEGMQYAVESKDWQKSREKPMMELVMDSE